MQQILDLHIHSRYSRACSPQLTLENIDRVCRTKGVDIVGTGDFTYPAWFHSITEELAETFPGSGLFRLKAAPDDSIRFMLSTEVSLIYKDKGKVRRLHLVVHAPSIKAAAELNKLLDKRFNIRSDGRPILGISAPEFVRLVLGVDGRFLIYPAHIWTPWFSVFGSKSGFNSLEECFEEEAEHIWAIETGLSSDPEMNWRLSALDNLAILSNSDAHSLNNIGREATAMDIAEDVSYEKIRSNIKKKEGFRFTIEFFPEEGMYHFDGHRDCSFSCSPEESRRLKNICPKCKKPLIIGVLNRVEELADRKGGIRPTGAAGFKKLVELDKIIAEALDIKSRSSKRVQQEYYRLIERFGNELHILLDADLDAIAAGTDHRIVEGLRSVRKGDLSIEPGFDGRYGKINIFTANSKPDAQRTLF